MKQTSCNIPLLILLGLLSAVIPAAYADTIQLKNGKTVEGNIINDGPDGVVVEYNVTASIKDQKTIPREEIASMVTLSPDDKAFQALGSLTSPTTVLDTGYYDVIIDKKIPEFIAAYPYSKHVSPLRAASRSLDAERARIRQGDRKIDGVWITAAEIQADPAQSDARIKFAAMKVRTEAGDPVGALQGYELLEKNYPTAKVMPDAVDLALKNLAQLQQNVAVAEANFSVLDKDRQKALGTAVPGQTNAAVGADEVKALRSNIEQETLSAKTAMKKAEVDGTKFFPIFQSSKEALDALQTLVATEKIRLTALQKSLAAAKASPTP